MTQTQFSVFEQAIMQQVLDVAGEQIAITLPNPATAAVVVKNGEIIAIGKHLGVGTDHAEVDALKKAGDNAKDAILFVNLEPCTHWGKTPPCTDAIIAAEIAEVVYAIDDPNLLVRECPAEKVLGEAGIKVRKGCLKKEAEYLNRVFLKNQSLKAPYVILKAGISLDGKIASTQLKQKYITSEASRCHVHQIRQQVSGLIIGVGTVLNDDPLLNCRHGFERHAPLKIVVLDDYGDCHQDLKLFQHHQPQDILIITTKKGRSSLSKIAHLAIIKQVEQTSRSSDYWQALLSLLFESGVCNVIVEGGRKVYTSAINAAIVDEVNFYMAPLILGQKGAVSIVGDIDQMSEFEDMSVKKLGNDILIQGFKPVG